VVPRWARICPCLTGKPPHVDDDMMDRMRLILSFCILGQLLSMSLASGASGPSDSAYSVYRSGMGWAAFLWALITWIVYEGFPLGLIPCLRDFSQLSSSISEDTQGIAYDRVTELKRYEIEEYECPAARRGDVVKHGQSTRSRRGATSGPRSQPPAFNAAALYPSAAPQEYTQPEVYSAAGTSYPPAAPQPRTYPPPLGPTNQQGWQEI